ncbi:hypothetical protein ACV229_02240 [Burkholderia sp. MR1-5-21]
MYYIALSDSFYRTDPRNGTQAPAHESTRVARDGGIAVDIAASARAVAAAGRVRDAVRRRAVRRMH